MIIASTLSKVLSMRNRALADIITDLEAIIEAISDYFSVWRVQSEIEM